MSFLGKFNNLSLRVKFVITISLLIITSGALVSYYLISKHMEGAERGLIYKGSALIKVLAVNCEYGTFIENEAILDELIGATIARRRRTSVRLAEHSRAMPLRHLCRPVSRAVIDDNDLIVCDIYRLGLQRSQAGRKCILRVVGRDDHRDFRHRGGPGSSDD